MKQSKNITVFGASGNIGSLLVQHLSTRCIPTVAVSRHIDKQPEIPSVQWIEADMSSKESLYRTMENTTSVFLLSGHSPHFVEEQCNVIDVAKAQGVKHIVKLSSGAADKYSSLMIPKVHGEVEDVLRNCGIDSTFLRPTGMMQNWLGEMAQCIKTEGKIYDATGAGKRAYIDIRDIAEVAFHILIQPEQHASHAYFLTGGKAVNYYEIADMISCIIHEKVEFIHFASMIFSKECGNRASLSLLSTHYLLMHSNNWRARQMK